MIRITHFTKIASGYVFGQNYQYYLRFLPFYVFARFWNPRKRKEKKSGKKIDANAKSNVTVLPRVSVHLLTIYIHRSQLMRQRMR